MEANSEEEKAICRNAIERLTGLLKDAINQSGIWAEDVPALDDVPTQDKESQ